jgi:hypothetical protein
MAQSYKEYPSGSVTLTAVTYAVPFKYLSIDDVNVIGFDGEKWTPLALDASAPRSATNKTVTLATAPNALYTKIRLYRASSTTQLVDFQNGSRLSESDLDTAYQQGLFVAQEISEDASTTQFRVVRESAVAAGTSLSNFASQAFTGDGSTKVFTLTAFAPQTEGAEAYRVSIDGVMQSPIDAYTISMSNSTITFLGTVAPPTDSKIVVVTAASAASSVSVDDVTIGLTSANKTEIKDLGVTNAKLAGGITRAKFSSDALSVAYPVGSIYMNASNSDNPSTLLGFGTWEAFGAGKVPVGIDATDNDFDIVGSGTNTNGTTGAKTHILATTEIPPHTHTYYKTSGLSNAEGFDNNTTARSATGDNQTSAGNLGENGDGTGNASPHNNLQPYVVVHMWKRTA